MITLKNSQRRIPVDTRAILRDARKILSIVGYEGYDLGIWITTNRTIRVYNRTYRHKDTPTDVLSFPYYPELKAGKRIRAASDEEKNVGDLIFSAEYIVKEAEKYNVSFLERFQLLLVHGMCHLLGYDHILDTDYRRMRAKEVAILKKLKEN